MTQAPDPKVLALIREILGESYTHYIVQQTHVDDDPRQRKTSVECVMREERSEEEATIRGEGVGLVDALFQGAVIRFADEYPSLRTIQFARFELHARMDTKRHFSGTDSKIEVTIEVLNSEGRGFTFSHMSRSVITACVLTSLAAVEYFINSERAFVVTFHALRDARDRQRADLIQHFTNNLATLVQNTSYSEVIEKLRSEAGLQNVDKQ